MTPPKPDGTGQNRIGAPNHRLPCHCEEVPKGTDAAISRYGLPTVRVPEVLQNVLRVKNCNISVSCKDEKNTVFSGMEPVIGSFGKNGVYFFLVLREQTKVNIDYWRSLWHGVKKSFPSGNYYRDCVHKPSPHKEK